MIEQVLSLLENKEYVQVRALLEKMNPVDIADIFKELNWEESIKFYRILPKETAAEAFAYMEPETQEALIAALTDTELKGVLDSLYMDDTVDMLEEMPANVVKRVLKVSSPEDRDMINKLLRYEEDTAGSWMTTEFLDLKKEMTVKDAFDRIRVVGEELEDINTCYVTDSNRILEGVLTVRDLLLSKRDVKISDLMDENVIYVKTSDDQEEIAKIFQKYDVMAVPVVDSENRLVGIITIDDAVDLMQEENTEDFERMAAMLPSDDTYLKTSAFTHAKKRIVWLLILMLSATVTSRVINHYEAAFAALPLLVSFIPMLMDTGGNCGNQTSTLMIRGLALDEIQLRDWPKIIWKEIRVAAMVGVTLGVLNTLWIWLLYRDFPVAATVGTSLVLTVFIAKSIGCTLPILAKTCKLDPALMASPMITTIVDCCSIFIYFNIALAILPVSP